MLTAKRRADLTDWAGRLRDHPERRATIDTNVGGDILELIGHLGALEQAVEVACVAIGKSAALLPTEAKAGLAVLNWARQGLPPPQAVIDKAGGTASMVLHIPGDGTASAETPAADPEGPFTPDPRD